MPQEHDHPYPRKKKYFTVEQANRTLPLVRAIVTDLLREFQELNERRERLVLVRRGGGETSEPYREETEQMIEQLQQDAEHLQRYLDELNNLGVEFKDFRLGLVDFPTFIDGREAYLCWKLGEEEVAHWHDLDAGYRGRQPLTTERATGIQGAVPGQ